MGVPQSPFSYLRRRFIIVLNAICRAAGRISATTLYFDLANPFPEYRCRRASPSGIARLYPVGFSQNRRDTGEIVEIQRKQLTICLDARVGVMLQSMPGVVVLRNQSKALDVPAHRPSDHTSPPHGPEVEHFHPVGPCRAAAQEPLDPVRDLGMPADGARPTSVAVRQQHSFHRAHGRILGGSDCRTLNPFIPKRGAP